MNKHTAVIAFICGFALLASIGSKFLDSENSEPDLNGNAQTQGDFDITEQQRNAKNTGHAHTQEQSAHEAVEHMHEHDSAESTPGLDALLKNSFQPQDHWFDSPTLIDSNHYLSRDIPVEGNRHCSTNPLLKSDKSFAENISDNYGHDVSSTDASDTFFKSLTQFFSHKGRFWQITLIWENDMPAIYRYELFSSASRDFTKDVQSEIPPLDFPGYPDAIASQEWLNQLLELYNEQGATSGSRIVEQRVIDEKGKSHEWVTQNGDLISWQFDSGVCVLDSTGSQARCACSHS